MISVAKVVAVLKVSAVIAWLRYVVHCAAKRKSLLYIEAISTYHLVVMQTSSCRLGNTTVGVMFEVSEMTACKIPRPRRRISVLCCW